MLSASRDGVGKPTGAPPVSGLFAWHAVHAEEGRGRRSGLSPLHGAYVSQANGAADESAPGGSAWGTPGPSLTESFFSDPRAYETLFGFLRC